MAEVRSVLESVIQWEMLSLAPLTALYHFAGQISTMAVTRRFMERRSEYHNPEALITSAVYSWNAVLACFVPSLETSVDSLEV